MKMKRKTKKELERENTYWTRVLIISLFLFVIGSVFIYFDMKDELQTQLSECQDKVPDLSNLYIFNNSKGEYSVSVRSKNGALIPSDDIRLKKLNDLISYSHSEEWKNYVYTFEEKYYIDGEQVFPKKELYPCCEDLLTEGYDFISPFTKDYHIINGEICRRNCEIISNGFEFRVWLSPEILKDKPEGITICKTKDRFYIFNKSVDCEVISKPSYCYESFLDYALTEEQIRECYK